MSRTSRMTMLSLTLVAIASLAVTLLAHGPSPSPTASPSPSPTASPRADLPEGPPLVLRFRAQGEQLDGLSASLTAARAAADKGDLDQVRAQIRRAAETVAAMRAGLSDPPVANVRDPITGVWIDPFDVPENLVREFGGMRIGFVGADCLTTWDKLARADQLAKLQIVLGFGHRRHGGRHEVGDDRGGRRGELFDDGHRRGRDDDRDDRDDRDGRGGRGRR